MLAFALILSMPLISCPNESNPGNGEVYLVDVSEETDWDYLVIAKDGSSAFYNVDETTGIPTSLFFKPDKNSDTGTTILFKENGLPDRMVSNGYILVYDNFRGYQYDMAVIKPDNTIEYHYGIETDVNWGAYKARAISGQGRAVKDVLDTGLDIAGHAMGLGSCAAILINPAFGIGCASYLGSEAGNLLVDKLVDTGALTSGEGELAHTLIDALGCMSLEAFDCIVALNSVVNLLFSYDLGLLAGKNNHVLETYRTMDDDDWRVMDSKFTKDIEALAYGGGMFVAGGKYGEMAYSPNGVNWTAVADRPFGSIWSDVIHAIAYGGGKFVAVGSHGKRAYSTNGITWTAATDSPFGTSSNGTFNAIAYGGGRFVAVYDRGKIAYSDNGITWTAVADSTFDDNDKINAIAYGGGKFVAGGYFGKLAYSANGIIWGAGPSNILAPDFSSGSVVSINAIAYGDGVFVVAGGTERMGYSTDGSSWTTILDPKFIPPAVNAIAYGDGVYVAVGNSGKTAYSNDGITWASGTNRPLGGSNIYAIAYGNGRFVAGGEDGKIMAYSTDGGGIVSEGDTIAPVLSSGSVNRISDTQASIGFTSSEAGYAYYIVQDSGAAAPANTAVRNGVPLGVVTAGANSGKKVVTLTAGAKDIYVVVQDPAGNISEPLKIAAAAYSGGGGGGSGERDSRLVNGANDAWLYIIRYGWSDGFIFKADGACQLINDYDGEWAVGSQGTWTTSGNNSLNISHNGEFDTYSYTVNGNTLTLDDGGTYEYIKQTVSVIGRSAFSFSSAGNSGWQPDTAISKHYRKSR